MVLRKSSNNYGEFSLCLPCDKGRCLRLDRVPVVNIRGFVLNLDPTYVEVSVPTKVRRFDDDRNDGIL